MDWEGRRRVDASTMRNAGEFLFGKVEEKIKDAVSKFLDMRTDISGREMFNAITYYRVLGEYFHCDAAKLVGDLLERLLISRNRMGRKEAVTVLLGELQKVIEEAVPYGAETIVE